MPKPKRKDWTPLEVSVLRQVKSQKKVPWKTKQEIFRERIDNLYHGMSQRPPTRTVQAMMTKIRRVRRKDSKGPLENDGPAPKQQSSTTGSSSPSESPSLRVNQLHWSVRTAVDFSAAGLQPTHPVDSTEQFQDTTIVPTSQPVGFWNINWQQSPENAAEGESEEYQWSPKSSPHEEVEETREAQYSNIPPGLGQFSGFHGGSTTWASADMIKPWTFTVQDFVPHTMASFQVPEAWHSYPVQYPFSSQAMNNGMLGWREGGEFLRAGLGDESIPRDNEYSY